MKHRFWIALILALALMLTAFAEDSLIIEGAVEPIVDTVDGVSLGNIELETSDGLPALGAAGEQLSEDVAPQAETNDVEMNAVPTELCLGVGETYRLRSKGSTFRSSKKSVATVNDAGLVTAVKAGKARITIRNGGKTVGECLVIVRKAPNKVALSKTRLVMAVGESYLLKAVLPEKTASNAMSWKSSNRDVVTVDGNGAIKAKGTGKAKITVKTFNGKKAVCSVSVAKKPFPYEVSKGVITGYCGVGGKVELPAKDPNGKAITAIGKGAFKGNEDIVEVFFVLTDISRIGASAFESCKNLKTVVMSGSTKTVGSRAFAKCASLRDVFFPRPVVQIDPKAFKGDKGLTFYSWANSDAEAYAKKHGYAFVVEYPAGSDVVRLDEAHFPDEAFRRYLSAFDKDGDGILSETEIGFIHTINVTNKKITSMRGVEYLTSLLALYCDGNGLTELDVSKNTALKLLGCSYNKLTELDVSANKNLVNLDCRYNMLTKLDLSGNHNLKDVKCRNNKLENLNVRGATELNTLVCNMNPFKSLDITGCKFLVAVVLTGKQSYNGTAVIYESTEAHLTVEKKVKLITGVVPTPTPEPTPTPTPQPVPSEEIPVDAAHFPDEVFREYVAKECDPDGNGRLSGAEIVAVELIDVHSDKITSLEGIQYFTALKALYCYSCSMKSLDVSKNENLEILYCNDNYLSELNLSGCARLKTLLCGLNRLKNLDISACVELTELVCSQNRLQGLDISLNTKLAKLLCEGNYFYQLDIRKCPALIDAVKRLHRTDNGYYVTYETDTLEVRLRYNKGVELIK